jgi:hypothetical protein
MLEQTEIPTQSKVTRIENLSQWIKEADIVIFSLDKTKIKGDLVEAAASEGQPGSAVDNICEQNRCKPDR